MGSLALLPAALPPLLEATPFPEELLTCSSTADLAVKGKTNSEKNAYRRHNNVDP